VNLDDYTPNDRVLAYIMGVHFVGVIGPTAVGKSTLIDRAMQRDSNLHLIRSTTSRPARPGEQDGLDMHFRTADEMIRRIERREYVNAMQLFDNYYATAPEDYSNKGVSLLPLAAHAARDLALLPFRSVRLIYVLPPSFEVWQERIAGRATNGLEQRIAEAVTSLQFALTTPDIVFVLNDDLDVATEDFVDGLHGSHSDQDQQAACLGLAKHLLAQLQNRLAS
jgi:guanylate kinase